MASTIFALSSGPGKAGVAIIRISGSRAKSVIEEMLLCGVLPREASLRTIIHPKTKDVLDKGLVIYFEGPESFTGEDCVELQVHGGRAVVQGVLEALSSLEDFSMAEPGEFSRRAFHNNKLDLLEVEGLADLIDAETEAQRKQAQRQMDGQLSSIYGAWRAQMIKAMALFEAGIDFADEEDVPKGLLKPVRDELTILKQNLERHLNDNRRGERLRGGLKLVIIGKPNVGKSSLMNYLTKRNAAIVSDTAGTTRDVIETHLDIGGYPVILTDTAGIRRSDEQIERVGVALALKEAKNADLVLYLEDINDQTSSEEAEKTLAEIDSATIRVMNKADLLKNGHKSADAKADCIVSVKEGSGLDALLLLITDKAKELSDTSESPSLTRTRHRTALLKTIEHIQRALENLGEKDEELVAEDLRQAAYALGTITGHVGVEDLLDVIFAQFCIGK